MKKNTISMVVWLLTVVAGSLTACNKNDEGNPVPANTPFEKSSMQGEGNLFFNNEKHEVQTLAAIKHHGFGFNTFQILSLGTKATASISLTEDVIPAENKKYVISGNYDVTPGSTHAFVRITDSDNNYWLGVGGTLYFKRHGNLVVISFNDIDIMDEKTGVIKKSSLTLQLK